jgi:membrane-associated PAP2 superfamily phosphatase
VRLLDAYVIPVIILTAILLAEWFDLDHAVMSMLYDTQTDVFPLRHHWLTEGVIHSGGRQLMAVFAVAVLVAVTASLVSPSIKPFRREWCFVVLSIVTTTLFISTLKATTGMHCAYDLARYGGTQPANQLANLWSESAGGACWPGGHVSGPISLVAVYFAFLARKRWFAFSGLILAVALGSIFGIGQTLRGAHFPTHTLWTLLIVWIINVILSRAIQPATGSINAKSGVTL